MKMKRMTQSRNGSIDVILALTTFVLLAATVRSPGQPAAGSPAGTSSTAPAAGKTVQQTARPGSAAGGTGSTGTATNTGTGGAVFVAPSAPTAPSPPMAPRPPLRNGVQPVQTQPPINNGVVVPATNSFAPPMNNFQPATNNFIPPANAGTFVSPPNRTIPNQGNFQARPMTNGFLPSQPGTGTNGFLPSQPGTGTNGFLPFPPGTDTNGLLPNPRGAGTNGFLPNPGTGTNGAANSGVINQ